MKKLLLTTLAALVCVAAHAEDIMVYKHNFTVTRTGAGISGKPKITGWTILDGQTMELSIVTVEANRKRFSVQSPSYVYEVVYGSLGKSYSIFKIDDGTLTGLTIKGLNKRTDIFVLNYYMIPGTATISGNDVYRMGDDPFYDEYKGSFVLDKANTKTPLNRTMEEKLQFFKNLLIAKGYSEEF